MRPIACAFGRDPTSWGCRSLDLRGERSIHWPRSFAGAPPPCSHLGPILDLRGHALELGPLATLPRPILDARADACRTESLCDPSLRIFARRAGARSQAERALLFPMPRAE